MYTHLPYRTWLTSCHLSTHTIILMRWSFSTNAQTASWFHFSSLPHWEISGGALLRFLCSSSLHDFPWQISLISSCDLLSRVLPQPAEAFLNEVICLKIYRICLGKFVPWRVWRSGVQHACHLFWSRKTCVRREKLWQDVNCSSAWQQAQRLFSRSLLQFEKRNPD